MQCGTAVDIEGNTQFRVREAYNAVDVLAVKPYKVLPMRVLYKRPVV